LAVLPSGSSTVTRSPTTASLLFEASRGTLTTSLVEAVWRIAWAGASPLEAFDVLDEEDARSRLSCAASALSSALSADRMAAESPGRAPLEDRGAVETSSGRGIAAVDAPAAPDPEAPPPLCPVEPSTVSTAVTRCAPGRKTTCPSAIVPVTVASSDSCHVSTASVVAACQMSSRMIRCSGSNPSLRRSRFSSRTSGAALTLGPRSR
jgi:hypothetical protein